MTLSELMLAIEELCSVAVSVEIVDQEILECRSLRLPQDQYLHHSEVCRRNKLSSHFMLCRKNKDRSIWIARKGRTFCGRCPHGVWEIAVPVIYQKNLIAVIYLGGITTVPDEAKRKELRGYGRFIARFIVLELLLYAKINDQHRKRRDEKYYLSNCRRFLEEKYSDPVSLTDLADSLNVNPNYLGKLLHRKLGKTFRELLAERRMNQSEILVRLHQTLNITEIARLCGFSDSNYFCVVFKKHFGMPPREYREHYRAKNLPDADESAGRSS